MATRRKHFQPKDGPPPTDQQLRSDFLGRLLAGQVRASLLVETRDGQGRISLDYDDPNG